MYMLKRLNRELTYYIAFSGGVDSVVLTHYLLSKGVNVKLLYIDHLDNWSKTEMLFARQFSNRYNLKLKIYSIEREPMIGDSKEAIWSKERDAIYQQMDYVVLTGHHLDDAVEWYLMTTLGQGNPYLMNHRVGNVIRPFLITKKSDILEYAIDHKLEYLSDPSNKNNKMLRNRVRNVLLPQIEEVFPGIRKTVKNLIMKKERKNDNGLLEKNLDVSD